MHSDGREVGRATASIPGRAGGLIASAAGFVERFSQNRMHVALISAFASGLCVSGLVWVVSTSSGDGLPVLLNIKTTLVALGAYAAVALFLQRLWTGLLRRVLPHWIMVAVLGSLLFIIIEIVPIKVGLTMWSSSGNFIKEELEGLRLFYILLCCITLPVTATVYYAGSIVRLVRRWRDGAEPPLSVLGNNSK